MFTSCITSQTFGENAGYSLSLSLRACGVGQNIPALRAYPPEPRGLVNPVGNPQEKRHTTMRYKHIGGQNANDRPIHKHTLDTGNAQVRNKIENRVQRVNAAPPLFSGGAGR